MKFATYIVILLVFAVVQGFQLRPHSLNRRQAGGQPMPVLRKSDHDIDPANNIAISTRQSALSSARKFLQVFLSLGITNFIADMVNKKAAFAKTTTEEDFIDALATMIVAQRVIEPTNVYVDVQAYDSARSNIKYILNQLQLQKKVSELVQNSIDFTEDMDSIEAAQEAGNRLANTAMQYDSSVYTCVFIPSDGGQIPPNAEKYRREALNYYQSF
eukprot:gene31043-37521_t